jgi:hypothetical protein
MTAGEWRRHVSANGPRCRCRTWRRFPCRVGGVNKTGSLVIPNIGGWQNWTDITATVALNIGL